MFVVAADAMFILTSFSLSVLFQPHGIRFCKRIKMDTAEENFFVEECNAKTSQSSTLVNESERDLQMEVNDLFKNINSWRDESQRQLSIIIDSHTNSINRAIKNVVEEVCEIKSQHSQVSAIVKERDDLQETVNNLKGYIEHLSAKVPPPKLVDTQQNLQDEDSIDSTQVEYHSDSEDRPPNNSKSGDPQGDIDFESMTEVSDDPQDHLDFDAMIERPVQEQNKLPLSIIDHITGFICNDCDFESSTSEDLENHLKNAHIKQEPSELSLAPIYQINLSKFKKLCKQCPYETANLARMNQHMVSVHKIGGKMLKCEECTYSTVSKQCLKRHISVMHDKTRARKHACEECGYAAFEKSKLRVHIERVHRKIPKTKKINKGNHVCEDCGHTVSLKSTLDQHRLAVHLVEGKKFECDKCPYKAALKNGLRMHQTSVHTEEADKLKCDMCPYTTAVKRTMKIHIKSHSRAHPSALLGKMKCHV